MKFVKYNLTSLLLTLVLALVTINCGGGATSSTFSPPPPPPPSNLSITTSALPNWMATFAYNQTIQASGGVAPFVWTISSGSLPHGVTLAASTTNAVTVAGVPDTVETAVFSIQVKDAKNGSANQSYTVNISKLVSAQMQQVSGQAPAGVIEIQGLSAGPFNPESWQRNTLNWVPDVRIPMLAAQTTGPNQNIYAPWPLEQPNGWRLFYGGWDGTDTSNDRVYSATTPDFLSFANRTLVIDHGVFQHVNNESVQQLPDGSMHMICTVCCPGNLDKPAYFSSPDGATWNGSPEPYSAQLSDMVSIPNDSNYQGWDFNGGNVLLWDNNDWTLYYSVGVYAGIGQVYRATSSFPPTFQKTGMVLSTQNYSNDVKKFSVGGKTWYLMSLYVNENVPNPPILSYSLSNDGIQFGPEQELFAGAFPQDQFLITPAFVTRGNQILGVLYGADSTSLIQAQNAIFARWLQRKMVVTDGTGTQVAIQGGYGPDRQWIQAPLSGSLNANVSVYAEDGITPLGKGTVSLNAGQAYMLVLQ
ncbi:MAG TPA: Ig domain-containing protein [Candidatus Angelobacter sp.]|nr:Ig domain-containing protein [Candidatus Angelobacter sp.]